MKIYTNRRAFFGTLAAVAVAVYTNTIEVIIEGPDLSGSIDADDKSEISNPMNGDQSIGESVSHTDLEVSVIDAQKIQELHFARDGEHVESIAPPRNAELIIAKLYVKNDDIETREAPRFNLRNYKRTQGEVGEKSPSKNEILIYSGDEKGAVGISRELKTLGYDSTSTNDTEVEPYPYTISHSPDVPPTNSLKGWVFGLIEKGERARLRVDIGGETSFWSLENLSESN